MRSTFMILVFAAAAIAQTQTTGRIAGTVYDQTGAVVAGAQVTIINQANGEERVATTDNAGEYDFAFLTPAVYRLRVNAAGFDVFNAETVRVGIAETVTVNATLAVAGIVSDPVKVIGGRVIRTDGPVQGIAFDRSSVAELPLSTRNFTQLLALAPGVSAYLVDNTTVGRNPQNVSVNGSRVSQNNLQINGVDANWGVSANRPIPNPAPETIAEVRVQTSLYDASFGRSGGASVQVVTQSGSNELHGTVYGFFRDTALTANNPFLKGAGLPRPVLKRATYGATLSGAIRQNRAFFFVSYQGTRDRNGASRLNSLSTNVLIGQPPVPLTDDRSATSLSTLFNVPLSMVHPISLSLLNARLPNGEFLIPTPQANARYFGSAISRYREEQFNANFDYRVSRQNLFSTKVFYSTAPETLARDALVNVPGFPIVNTGENLLISIQDVHTFGANIVNEARIGYNLVKFSNTTQQPFSHEFGIVRSTSAQYPGMPIIRVAPNVGGLSFGTLGLRDAHGSIPTASLADTLSFSRRSHFIRAGLEIRQYGNNLNLPIQTRGNIIFQNFRSFVMGTTQSTVLANGIAERSLRSSDFNFFVQDDWKPTRNLTLNLGLRYELDLPPYDTRGRIATFDPALYRPPRTAGGLLEGGLVQAGNALPAYDLPEIPNVGKRVVHSIDPNNFAPRLGLAYSPLRNDVVVIRGGYGVFYSRSSFGYLFSNIYFPPFYFAGSRPSANLGAPFTTNIPSFHEFPKLVPNALIVGNAFDRNIRTPYLHQFNFGAQFYLGAETTFEAAYVGTRGQKLFRQVAINQAQLASPLIPVNGITTNIPANAQARVPYRGVAVGGGGAGFLLDQTTAVSNYHSLQLSLTRRMSSGLQFLMSYTLSRSIDNASGAGGGTGTDGLQRVGTNLDSDVIVGNQLDDRANRGLSNFDRKHRFVSSFLWEVPSPRFANRSSAGRLILSGWQISGIVTAMSGLPIDIVDSQSGTFYLGSNGGGGRPSWDPDRSATSGIPPGYYFNPYAFFRPVVLATQPIPSSGGAAVAGPECTVSPDQVCTDFGDVERNALRGPRQFNTDIAIAKRFRLTDSRNIEFRVEFFNLFNTVNYANPISNFAAVQQSGGMIDPGTGRILPGQAGDFGKVISTTNNPRLAQIAIKFNF